jgi:hypothetical protein
VFGLAAPFFLVLAAHARIFVPARRVGRAITCITLGGLTGVFLMQLGTGALIDLVANAGGTAATGYRLVFLSVIGILLVSALIYRGQPETPDEI